MRDRHRSRAYPRPSALPHHRTTTILDPPRGLVPAGLKWRQTNILLHYTTQPTTRSSSSWFKSAPTLFFRPGAGVRGANLPINTGTSLSNTAAIQSNTVASHCPITHGRFPIRRRRTRSPTRQRRSLRPSRRKRRWRRRRLALTPRMLTPPPKTSPANRRPEPTRGGSRTYRATPLPAPPPEWPSLSLGENSISPKISRRPSAMGGGRDLCSPAANAGHGGELASPAAADPPPRDPLSSQCPLTARRLSRSPRSARPGCLREGRCRCVMSAFIWVW